MSKNKQQEYVRPLTTGHVEADMLGLSYLWISERTNRKYAQRPHRTYQRKSKVRGIFRVATEWVKTAPSACWRSIKYANKYGRRLASVLRKKGVNGK